MDIGKIPIEYISEDEKIMVDFYLAGNTKLSAYKLLRRLKGENQIQDASAKKNATKLFQEQYIAVYLKKKEAELYTKYAREVVKTDSTTSITALADNIDLATAKREDVNKFLVSTLRDVINNPESSQTDIIQAVNRIADIRDSKEKTDKTEMSEYDKTIHYCLPADMCEDCPNKEKIYAEYGFPATEEEIKKSFYKK